MPSYLQAKLLRVLQEREFRPIGSDRSVRVDFRLICATNVDVEAALRDGRLREDLYFRINTITMRVPALRERLEDLAPLCQHFLGLYNARHGRNLRGVSPAAYHRLMQHRWPGNVRELENVIERGVLVARGPDLQPDDLPDSVTALATPAGGAPDLLPATATLAAIERMAILQALQRTNWNKQDAAQQLGLYRPTLYSKMKKHGITSPPRPRRRLAAEVPSEPPA
jgi:DNA-binding NtrC family response regulator